MSSALDQFQSAREERKWNRVSVDIDLNDLY